MIVAYIFSFAIRMIWVSQVQGNPEFYWNGQLMINTNDGYFFASGAQKVLESMHLENPRIPDMWSFGTVFFTVLFTKFTPFELETVILYMPAIISSLVVVPIILIARLYGMTLWGFFAALLGSVAWSYYNRTMTGYYDTDMFSAMAPMFILYFLMKSVIDFRLKSSLYAALAIAVYPFLYEAGATIVNAMGVLYAIYLIVYHRREETTYYSIILVFLALIPFPVTPPISYLLKIGVLIALYFGMKRVSVDKKVAIGAGILLFFTFMYLGNVFGLIFSKIAYYTTTGTTEKGLHFYSVSQTIREAGKIPFSMFANRISGSQTGLILSLVGYIVLVIRHRAFILALPLIGIGIFALWGGLRFTVYAVPIAAMSAVYLFYMGVQQISEKRNIQIIGMVLLTAAILYPNITHIIAYRVPTVLNKSEVKDLVKLQKLAKDKDYTLAWWDYGYPIWFYSNTNTIIDGGKHNNDNFIISKIMQTDSPELAANLSRLAVETYVDSNYTIITDKLFHSEDGKKIVDPNLLLAELENSTYKMPKKSRDIYLYLPYRMLNIFPTVAVFGNLDLMTGKTQRKILFYPTQAMKKQGGILQFSNGIVFDMRRGILELGDQKAAVKYFVITRLTKEGKTILQTQPYSSDGNYVVLYMESYRQFIVMDEETFNSMYVQMFILGRYDKNLFELIVSSPYSKIYKLKR
jgi:dolichyl-diphosphooligosaccharide--protein glycosyltransferase/undecaprenyl-diphosphooligosaccharide--protein glycosyltransferase